MPVLAIVLSLCVFMSTPVTLTTKNGATIDGTVALRRFTIDTVFGQASIEMARTSTISFGSPDIVVTRDGTVMRGRVLLEKIALQTRGGIVVFETADLLKLEFAGDPARRALDSGVARRGRLVLRDGGVLEGAIVPATFMMRTAFGEAEIEMAKVRAITFGARGVRDVVEASNGAKIEGRIHQQTFTVTTATGVHTVQREQIDSITLDHPV